MPGRYLAELPLTEEIHQAGNCKTKPPVSLRLAVGFCPLQILLRERIKPRALTRLGWVQPPFYNLGFLPGQLLLCHRPGYLAETADVAVAFVNKIVVPTLSSNIY